MFPKQTANSLVTETLQYFVFFCRSVYYANLVKCLIINDLRLIIAILFFIAFLNITYTARHTFDCIAIANKVSMESIAKMLGHSDIRTTKIYAKLMDRTVAEEMNVLKRKFSAV